MVTLETLILSSLIGLDHSHLLYRGKGFFFFFPSNDFLWEHEKTRVLQSIKTVIPTIDSLACQNKLVKKPQTIFLMEKISNHPF